MNRFEQIPDIRPNRHFPLGDVTSLHDINKAVSWISQATELEMEQYKRLINMNVAPLPTAGKNAVATHKSAAKLCSTWDGARGAQTPPLVAVGYRLGMTFCNMTRFLPPTSVNLSEQLDQMANDQQDLVREFAQFAWQGMEQHPNVHHIFEELLVVGRHRFGLSSDDDRDYFRAGLALPYVIASTSRLHGYTPKFTSMSDMSDPNATEFHQLFTTDVELAHPDRAQR